MSAEEQELAGGNASGSVVRVGDTVRKPWLDTSPAVQDFLATLRQADVDVPRPLGRDHQGRAVVEFVSGHSAMDHLPLNLPDLVRVGGMIRQIHDASEAFAIPNPDSWEMLLPAEKPDLMCHNDLAPWNLITGERWVFIDWDGAGPSTRLWDLAYSAQSFGLLIEGEPVRDAARRLRALVDGYDADASLRAALPAAMVRRTAAMHRLLESAHQSGFQPWADMFVNGHGAHWQAAARYVERNQKAWADALAAGD
ncbi:aminoglycoside phosphotransferase [Pseudarthrobacter chlorophenolicus A6]|uniref:Aminoglycoside phosphotransferase n=1 Tax=Pseudarthrobacter chlorophenolicus (strain ATCC 700700 / DSM 12829 / CIP 107037 / JCM 12360 / KCTC 9906 / NCIMB 13794 / A6) TaxID=452863 RepID=B8HEI2_PSECP|nr:phosphotransferase [Pseudarthrobacter chlorophenolicus]ACL40927.1 aminoglycoside phosphotransferase [Pseudarthrobacter chlorophenolicus A6]SDQ72726.1 Phosphotransferase enzyme family protein [Pseudarthrobacter chlorophenolicus]